MTETGPKRVIAIIPALNEEGSISLVLEDIPGDRVHETIVVDNGCTDATVQIANSCGARVIAENRRGYGNACQAGLRAAAGADIVLFLDGDYSDYPEESSLLLDTMEQGYDMVVGSRLRGKRTRGALPPHSVFGNWLICSLINILCGTHYTDLGPFRAVSYDKLMLLGMKDPNYGWTVEMALRAAAAGWRVCEVPVSYRRRHAGKSKVTGSITASVKTALKMFIVLIKLRRIMKKEKRLN